MPVQEQTINIFLAQARVFDRFAQASDGRSMVRPGTSAGARPRQSHTCFSVADCPQILTPILMMLLDSVSRNLHRIPDCSKLGA